jgi:sugar phosphate isomerase/epimerase
MMDRDGRLLLAFSTLGCPEWDAPTVVAEAARLGFDGIEWRGGPEGTVRTEWPAEERAALRRSMADRGLRPIAVTAYSNLISGDALVRRRSVSDLVAHLELAADLGAPWVRAFIGIADDDASADELGERAIGCLTKALDATLRLDVGLAIEPHDDHVRAAAIGPILDALPGPGLGVVWDIANGWAAGEAPATGLATYEGRIAWVQVKDGTGQGATWRLCGLGDGEVPIAGALAALQDRCSAAGEALPPISLEWERAWHRELDPAEVAFPAALAWLRATLGDSSAATAPGSP